MATAVCAWLHSQGVRVAPFKAQNMSNNSYPCAAGGEIGRAQVAQAWACGLEPEPAMNPILLKPNSDGGSQVVINGKVWKNLTAREYYAHHEELRDVVMRAYAELASRFDVVIIEGAGSVTELNLRAHDLVNLGLATQLSAPWLLVSDIERGGVFASVIGTVSLLTAQERSLLRAFAINKFRGYRSLFEEGRAILEERTACPCLGVFPYAPGIDVDDEDSLSLPPASSTTYSPVGRRCAVIRFPRISNTTDFRLLADASWLVEPPEQDFDFIFLPGTKNTILDLEWLRSRRLDLWILEQQARGASIIGVCGGYQMLGESIVDPHGMESDRAETRGLGLLPIRTRISERKTTRVVAARTPDGHAYQAYEIHLGETICGSDGLDPFAILGDGSAEGLRIGRVYGTYLHGAVEVPAVLSQIGISGTKTPERSFRPLVDWFEPFAERFDELFLVK